MRPVEFHGETVVFRDKVKPSSRHDFAVFVHAALRQHRTHVTLDFSDVANAYPNAMVPIIADVQRMIARGHKVTCVLPRDEQLRRLFRNTNWAHFLDPDQYDLSDTVSDRHLAVQRFDDGATQQQVVNNFIDVTMRTLDLERPVLQGLEWSLNEVTDNVLNHAESPVGGFVQLTHFRKSRKMNFCVADAGRGILGSLRESRPGIRTDEDAIAEVVKCGVTRNKDIGQGNGLSGTLKIATSAEGLLTILSGESQWTWSSSDARATHLEREKRFEGTVVDVQFSIDAKLDLPSVLSFGVNPTPYRPVDMIDMKYLSDDAKRLRLCVREETEGFGSRRAGNQIRTKCKNLMNAEPACVLMIDWDGIQMISSSFADEFVGKLFAELGPMNFMNRVKQVNAIPVVHSLLDRAIMQRMTQEVLGNGEPGSPG
jgi:hypothetical protein